MKKKLLFLNIALCFLILLSNNLAYSQTQIPNGNFENWKEIAHENPFFYNTSNTYIRDKNIHIHNLNKSIDSYKGKYSLKLETININGNPEPAFAVLGDMDNMNKGMALKEMPTHFNGFFKYLCENNDSAVISLFFKKNGEVIAKNYFYLYGVKNTFTEQHFSITGLNQQPDSVIIVFFSSNLFKAEPNPNAGNILMVDYISFSGINTNIPNNDFEIWYSTEITEPQEWTSLNEYEIDNPGITRSEEHTEGQFSAKLTTTIKKIEGKTKTIGFLTTGTFNITNLLNNNFSITQGGFPILSNPISLSFQYKYNNDYNTEDTALVIIIFVKYINNEIDYVWSYLAKLSSSQDFILHTLVFDIPDYVTADSANITISSSNYLSRDLDMDLCLGNELIVDEMKFIYQNEPSKYKVSGMITYDNKNNTPLSNVMVYLNSQKTKIDSILTDNSGNYHFSDVLPGQYSLTAKTNKAIYKIRPIEALMVNRNYLNLFTIKSELKKKAADVTGDKKITPIDALFINRHYLGLIKKFNVPLWIFENPSFEITNSDLMNINFKGISIGDIDGLYIPK